MRYIWRRWGDVQWESPYGMKLFSCRFKRQMGTESMQTATGHDVLMKELVPGGQKHVRNPSVLCV